MITHFMVSVVTVGLIMLTGADQKTLTCRDLAGPSHLAVKEQTWQQRQQLLWLQLPSCLQTLTKLTLMNASVMLLVFMIWVKTTWECTTSALQMLLNSTDPGVVTGMSLPGEERGCTKLLGMSHIKPMLTKS